MNPFRWMHGNRKLKLSMTSTKFILILKMHSSSKTTAMIQILGLSIVPVLLLISGIIPTWYRFIVLAIAVVSALTIMISERWTMKEIGIRLDNLANGAIPYALL